MCGIVGIIGAGSRDQIEAATDSLVHRGPDGWGMWSSADEPVSLGHRRLSIIDTSTNANQPMLSHDGRFCLIFNGEIYNYRKLRSELDVQLRTSSDTEVLLELIAKYGFMDTLPKLNGMFALAVYDLNRKCLHLARDRMGEKPLYFGKVGRRFAFASELKALRSIEGFSTHIDNEALELYMRYNYVPAPYCISKGLQKLQAAHSLTVDIKQAMAGEWPKQRCYWNFLDVVRTGVVAPLECDEREAMDMLEARIAKSVRSRMVSDVPLGAFLSGGYDSTLVVALMQQQSSQPIKTFSIGFEDEQYNEAAHARAVAKHLGTDHTEWILQPDDVRAVIEELHNIYCEPFADSSQIPTYLVSKLARQNVTVALSGDGGDELFGGYNRHFWAPRLWRRMRIAPRSMRRAMAYGIHALRASTWDKILRPFTRAATRQPGVQLYKLARVADAYSPEDLFRRLASIQHHTDKSLASDHAAFDPVKEYAIRCSDLGFAEMMMAVDGMTYLPEDILTKVDRASMAVSLETRVPLLDHELIELVWRIPQRYKIKDGIGKWIIKQIVHRHVPAALMERPKMGFAIPPSSIPAFDYRNGKKTRANQDTDCRLGIDPKSGMN